MTHYGHDHLSERIAGWMLPRTYRRRGELARIARSAFFQRYPYDGPVALDALDARGLIDFDLGVFFNRIPKAANSTVVVNLAKLRFASTYTSREAKKLFPRPSQIPARQLDQLNTSFKFVFVRHPYSRVLSAYLYRIRQQHRRYSGLAATSKNETPSFQEFCQFLKSGGLYKDTHWAPQAALLLLPVADFDFIGRFETLNDDLWAVVKRLRPNSGGDTLQGFDAHRTDATKRIDDFFDTRTRNLVADLYHEDFAAFGYQP